MRDFFDVPRAPRRTSAGEVELPILYFDVSNVIALFLAPRVAADALLAGTELTPTLLGGRAVVGLSCYEYRRTSVGVYNEVGTAIFATRRDEPAPRLALADLLRPPARRRVGAYVVDLPVTTALANAAGREIWGYPKFVTDIRFRLDGREVDSEVVDPARTTIVRLAGRLGRGVPAPPLSLMTYTHKDGALIRTHVDVRGPVTLHRAGSTRLTVGPSAHPMAAHLRTLGLADARPALVMRTDRFQSILHEGRVIH